MDRRNISLAFAALLSSVVCASAHEWYPVECCHSRDCAPVQSVAQSVLTSPPSMVVTTQFGTGIVPQDLERRVSPDNQMHACIMSGRVLCIFMPPGL